MTNYILENGVPVPCDDITKWAKWFGSADRKVASDHIGEVHVSTVFLGIDYSFGNGPAMLWETMIFGGEHSEYQERYTSREDAIRGHAKAVAMVKG